MERDELLNGLKDTQKAMEELLTYHGKIKNQNCLIREKEASLSKYDKKLFTKKSVFIAIIVLIGSNNLVGMILVFTTFFSIHSLRKKKREQMTLIVEQEKSEINKNINDLKNEMIPVQEKYNRVTGNWYPQDYSYLDACTFFISAVKNFRANNITEMVNLYEDELHKNKMVATQEAMIKGQQELAKSQQQMLGAQKLGNMLQVGNMAMQAATASAVRDNTVATVGAVSSNTTAINDLHTTIKNKIR